MANSVGNFLQSYFIRRLLFFVPTLFAVSVITFGMSQCVSGDPVAIHLGLNSDENTNATPIPLNEYENIARKIGADKPIFYCSVTGLAYPDTLFRFWHYGRRKTIEKTITRYGNWQKIEPYFQNLTKIEAILTPSDTFQTVVAKLWQTDEADKVIAILNQNTPPPSIQLLVENLKNQVTIFATQTARWKKYVPKINIYGFDNQFNNWIKNIFSGEFGKNRNGESVGELMKKPLCVTLFFGILTLVFSYAFALPLGVWLSFKKRTRGRLWVSRVMYFAYTLPTFSFATFLVIFFTNDSIGLKVSSVGLNYDFDGSESVFGWLMSNFGSFLLPIFCFSMHIIPILARQLRITMSESLAQEFIKTARGKGLSERAVRWRHALPTALAPIFASFGQLFPLLIGGSMVIELIFELPGMGSLMYHAVFKRDYPVLFGVTFLLSFATLLGSLAADLLHAKFDPRIGFKKK